MTEKVLEKDIYLFDNAKEGAGVLETSAGHGSSIGKTERLANVAR